MGLWATRPSLYTFDHQPSGLPEGDHSVSDDIHFCKLISWNSNWQIGGQSTYLDWISRREPTRLALNLPSPVRIC